MLQPGSTKFSFSMQLSASDPDSTVELPSKICSSVRNRFGVNGKCDYPSSTYEYFTFPSCIVSEC